MNLKDYLSGKKTTEFAKTLGIPSPLLSQWAHGVRRVPAERCIQIEEATSGDVRCEELRPDINWSVLRGKNASQQAA